MAHNQRASTVSIVDNSLHFVKNFSRFILKGLATHVYNSLSLGSKDLIAQLQVLAYHKDDGAAVWRDALESTVFWLRQKDLLKSHRSRFFRPA
jgi:hypothetical protein